jgi:predicted lipoprotein with Yx(FWY)xxD motif
MRRILVTAALLGAAVAWSPAVAQDTVTVKVETHDKYGEYLTDSQGKALYLFEADTRGKKKQGTAAVSTCYDDCAEAWPPLIAEGEPKAGDKVKAGRLGTIERKDGKQQVTYNGWPLYYFVKDQGPGDVKGQDVEGFGAEWYLVTPKGKKAHAKEASESKDKS